MGLMQMLLWRICDPPQQQQAHRRVTVISVIPWRGGESPLGGRGLGSTETCGWHLCDSFSASDIACTAITPCYLKCSCLWGKTWQNVRLRRDVSVSAGPNLMAS